MILSFNICMITILIRSVLSLDKMVNILNKIFAKIRFLFILNDCNNFFIIGTNVMEYYNILSGAQAQYDLFDLKI